MLVHLKLASALGQDEALGPFVGRAASVLRVAPDAIPTLSVQQRAGGLVKVAVVPKNRPLEAGDVWWLKHGPLRVGEAFVPRLRPGVAAAMLLVEGVPSTGEVNVGRRVAEENAAPLVVRRPRQGAVRRRLRNNSRRLSRKEPTLK